MYKFSKGDSISDLQEISYQIYGVKDDKIYSIFELLSNLEKFTMRALKGIRKNDIEKTRINFLIAVSWLMAVANRLHIDIEKAVWKRFPNVCSYCGTCPCSCKKTKVDKRKKIRQDGSLKPKSFRGFQDLFEGIYPSSSRNLTDAGIHLAEELGELSEAIHNYLGSHLQKKFASIEYELADYLSCAFGLANSAGIDLEKELRNKYSNNCHVCHNAPCTCSYSFVSNYKS